MKAMLLATLALCANLFAADFVMKGGDYVYRDTLVFDESSVNLTSVACESINGETKITGSDRNSVHVTVYVEIKCDDLEEGQKYLKSFRPVVAREDARLRIYGEYPDGSWSWNEISANMDFVIEAPAGLNLDASSANGEIVCVGMTGAADLECANGEISFLSETGTTGSISASCANGEIDVDVAKLNGSSSFECANGEIDVVVHQLLAANIDASTANGEITIALPENSSMRIVARSLVNGSIESDWAGVHDKGLIGDNYELVVNDGKYKIDCSSANGEITIRKSNLAN